MKTDAILLLVVLTILAACRKKDGPQAQNNTGIHPDYFVFGKNESNCMCNIAGVSYYMVNDGKLYSENKAGELFSKTIVEPDSDYQKAKALMDQFPAYLLSHPNTPIEIAPGEVDADVINIMAITGADTTSWHIYPNDTTQPAAVQLYMSQVQQTWQQLWH